ncbi:hypothetical protein cypCar_00001643 [Cyprinus carpio]|nr:hypothetical protein cypCar_00001643 [Cyprinus carpio]
MASSRQDYIAPWWTYWLHNFPHLQFNFQTVDSTFKPEDTSYQQVYKRIKLMHKAITAFNCKWFYSTLFVDITVKHEMLDMWILPQSNSHSLIFLACVSAVGLGLSLLVLSAYLTCLCCCRREEDEEVKRPNTCCVTWAAVITGLVIW